uniref:Cytochrome c oxidase subunit 2 n=1 Tax=Liposcelis bostrychophila TaxID=185214 RepID=A0A3Q8CR21_LIPBO|nr:cytochrome c oxidase subunit II [Liposcelis bostrychophila]ATU74597.1 cytochrome c oxidase subunit II [Liposcelis bostrychophila]UNO31811.1 cytochrome c oxidase subunit II [Liposcelis bostrychophila]
MEWFSFMLLESSGPIMEEMTDFHDHAMMILFLIVSFLTVVFWVTLTNKNLNLNILTSEVLEMLWTSLPVFILLFLAIPSIQVLFLMDEVMSPLLTIKIMGNQWFWTYEYSDLANFKFDSVINKSNIFRLLDVDKALILPLTTQIRLLLSSNDVIHSWTLPSYGLKIDANPGRLNASAIYSYRSGYFYGQCSEICGVDHSFMPIKVEFTPRSWFKNFVKSGC